MRASLHWRKYDLANRPSEMIICEHGNKEPPDLWIVPRHNFYFDSKPKQILFWDYIEKIKYLNNSCPARWIVGIVRVTSQSQPL